MTPGDVQAQETPRKCPICDSAKVDIVLVAHCQDCESDTISEVERTANTAMARLERSLATAKREREELRKALAEAKADRDEFWADLNRLDEIAENYWTLEAFNMPTGGGDYDVGWRVTESHEGKPEPVLVSVEYSDNPREALDTAIAALSEREAGR